MANVLYLALFAACACFMASRVYLLIFKGELNVKGVLYTRKGTPFGYWFTMFCATLGTVFSALMTIAVIFWIGKGM